MIVPTFGTKTIFLAIGFVYAAPEKKRNTNEKKLIAIMVARNPHDDENVMRADAALKNYFTLNRLSNKNRKIDG